MGAGRNGTRRRYLGVLGGFQFLAEPGNLIMMKKAEFEAFIAK